MLKYILKLKNNNLGVGCGVVIKYKLEKRNVSM